jgi:hypothetical protein
MISYIKTQIKDLYFYQISYIILLLSTTDYHYIIKLMKYNPCQTTRPGDL